MCGLGAIAKLFIVICNRINFLALKINTCMILIMKGVEKEALALRKRIVCWGLRAAQVKSVETLRTWQTVCFPKSVGSMNCLLSL